MTLRLMSFSSAVVNFVEPRSFSFQVSITSYDPGCVDSWISTVSGGSMTTMVSPFIRVAALSRSKDMKPLRVVRAKIWRVPMWAFMGTSSINSTVHSSIAGFISVTRACCILWVEASGEFLNRMARKITVAVSARSTVQRSMLSSFIISVSVSLLMSG